MKRKITVVHPVFDWIESKEAYQLMKMSRHTFLNNVAPDLSVSQVKNKRYYRVSELNRFLESNQIKGSSL